MKKATDNQQGGSVILLNCKFDEKDEVKRLGGRWNPDQKSWWVADNNSNRIKFKQWIPESKVETKMTPIKVPAIVTPIVHPNETNTKKRSSNTVIDLNPNKISALPIPSTSKANVPRIPSKVVPIESTESTSPIIPLTAEEIETRRKRAFEAANIRKTSFKQGGGGEKLKAKATLLEKSFKMELQSPSRWN